MRKELGKYVHFRQGSRRIDDIFLAIEKTFPDYEMEEPKSVDPAERELKSLDLEERIYEIFYGRFEVMPSWCPEFAKTCERVLRYSGMIIKELLKRGSTEDE